MALAPGDIVSEAEVIWRDIHSRYWIRGNGVKGYITPEYIPDDIRLMRGQKVKNVITLPRKNSQPFAISSYEDTLILYFYLRDGTIVDEPNEANIWVSRWREIASNTKLVDCAQYSQGRFLVPSPSYREWLFARANKWLMPIHNSIYFNAFRTCTSFCPSALNRTPHCHHILSACYKAGLSQIVLPLRYKGDLLLPGSPPKSIQIYLHGFLYPPKWHYGVWKHMLSGKPSRNKTERDLWELWLNTHFPLSSQVDDIFKDCKENQKESCCNMCSLEHFEQVHNALNDTSLLQIHWNSLVTMWESTPTKLVGAPDPHNDGFHEIEVLSFCEEVRTVNGRDIVFYPFSVLWGWIYNWDDTEGETILHLGIVTFFLRDNKPTQKPRTNWRRGKLENVVRV